jgi:Peptidase_C39 like family
MNQNLIQKFIVYLSFAASLIAANPAFAGDTLNSNSAMPPGSKLDSNNGCFTLTQQNDGNFVLYHNRRRQALWHTGTYNRAVKWTVMQGDGNLVTYDPNNRPIWASNTDRRGGVKLIMQNDGNAVIYRADNQPVWASNTVSSCSNLPTTTGQANNYFKTQYYSNWNPDGPSSSLNCGPASVAMLLKLFGKELANSSVQTSINRARQLMNAPGNTETSNVQMMNGLNNAGLRTNAYRYNGNFDQIDRDLADGKAVIIMGYYGSSWRNQFPNYSLTGNGNINHINTILGKTANGNYLVGDPMYRGGVVEMNRNQVAVFFSYNGGLHISASQ